MYMMDCILPFVESVLKSLQVAGSESLPHLPTGIEHSVPPLHIPSPLQAKSHFTNSCTCHWQWQSHHHNHFYPDPISSFLFYPYPILSLSYSILILLTSLITL